ncbi:MAG: preprotein translocase subunit YajC [Propionibacteriaceae bacterium]|jgi:preprotein translocase subunit YajC|nr:preprotein translocase subunit YajC [Propionibacteriaceae bacterium]
MDQITMFLIIALFIVVIYFMMVRPARKQQQKQQEMMDSLSVGSRVMLTSGIYGTIRHLGDKQVIIEISPGVDLTVLRRAVAKVATGDEEEFEYADAVDDETGLTADASSDEAQSVASPELVEVAEVAESAVSPSETGDSASTDSQPETPQR